jgi:hypothetical protein
MIPLLDWGDRHAKGENGRGKEEDREKSENTKKMGTERGAARHFHLVLRKREDNGQY